MAPSYWSRGLRAIQRQWPARPFVSILGTDPFHESRPRDESGCASYSRRALASRFCRTLPPGFSGTTAGRHRHEKCLRDGLPDSSRDRWRLRTGAEVCEPFSDNGRRALLCQYLGPTPFTSLGHEMKVVAHHTVGVHLPAGFVARSPQGFQEQLPDVIVMKNVFATVSPIH